MYTSTTLNMEHSQLHFNYQLATLQEEIEMKTSYLGKFRRTENASHLLDLVAMTKDETNLFTSLANEVSAEVFNSFRKGMLNIGHTNQEVTKNVEPIDVTENPIVELGMNILEVVADGNTFKVKGSFNTQALDVISYKVIPDIEVEYDTECYLLVDPDIRTTIHKKVSFAIPKEYISSKISMNGVSWTIHDYTFIPPLEPETDITSKESLASVGVHKIAKCKSYNVFETIFKIGDVIKVNGNNYSLTKETSINDLDLKNDTIKLGELDILGGVHYYATIPNYLQTPLVDTLDDAIKNALVYGIMWRWLLLAYPAEAETYAAFYANAKNEVYSRCNIFNRQYSKVPRIL